MTTAPASSFSPTGQTVDPANRPDDLSGAVLASLDRARYAYRARPWGLIKTAILSVLTLGIAPLLCWPRRLAGLAAVEQQQFWHLAEWLRLRTGRTEATALREFAANDLQPGPIYSVITSLISVAAVLILIQTIVGDHFFLDHLWSVSWRHSRHYYYPRDYLNFWQWWTTALCVGYFVHWFQVCRRAGLLAQFADLFNRATAIEEIPPVLIRGVGIGFSPFWLAGAAFGLYHGAIWAIPLAFAGVVQARYIRVTSRQARADFARRVRMMLQSNRPAMDLRPAPCVNKLCRAPIPPGATFCPRCGAHTA